MQYSALDIDEALRIWAEKLQPWVHLLRADPGATGQMSVSCVASVVPATSGAGGIGGIEGIGEMRGMEEEGELGEHELQPSMVLLDP